MEIKKAQNSIISIFELYQDYLEYKKLVSYYEYMFSHIIKDYNVNWGMYDTMYHTDSVHDEVENENN